MPPIATPYSLLSLQDGRAVTVDLQFAFDRDATDGMGSPAWEAAVSKQEALWKVHAVQFEAIVVIATTGCSM